MDDDTPPISSARRTLIVLKALAAADGAGMRLIDVAKIVGCNQPTAHRAMQDLVAEGFVEQVAGGKRYRLSLDFFVLAARAGRTDGLRELARPALLRLSSTLTDTIFLLVRSGYDAVCLDRVEGPFPIRSFTGDIGGKVPLGIGQGSTAILANLPEAEREAVIKFNMPRLLDRSHLDEASFRLLLANAREQGFVSFNAGLIPGMAGVAVPVCDASGTAVAALSVGTLSDRVQGERLQMMVDILAAEARELGRQINPFDPALRSPSRSLSYVQAPIRPL
jgi:DNA-binding IclR family transcriptional regulator